MVPVFVQRLPGLALALVMVPAAAGAATDFGYDTVVAKARNLAEQPFEAPAQVPQFLRDLTLSQYQEVRFRPEASLWRDTQSRFEVRMVPTGTYYNHAVALNEVDAEGVRPIDFDKGVFSYPSEAFAKRIPADLGYAGFRLGYPQGDDDRHLPLLTFAGASYFRGIGLGQTFGASARGIAIDTGLRSGEEYPAFTEYWIERPAAGADTMEVYGLLDGPSVTGAYRFRIRPGDSTRVEVTATLFFRRDIELLGLAPLTSMFYYGENTPRPLGEWRPQVHDSDGLLIHDGVSGEWLWRPLINPRSLRISYLHTEDVRGFGLMQRDAEFSRFEDPDARYDQRPSVWVDVQGDWGKGQVVLVEIPTDSGANDNIAAFWHPQADTLAGRQSTREYTVSFGPVTVAGEPFGTARQTFVGRGDRLNGGELAGAYRVIVDFSGSRLSQLEAGAPVVSKVNGFAGTEVLEHFVEPIAARDSWRLSMLVRPQAGATMVLRAYLSLEDQPLTETWTYELPAETGVRRGGR